MTTRLRRLALALPLLLATAAFSPAPAEGPAQPPPSGIDDIRVSRRGDLFRIEADLRTGAPPAIAWEVLTDFERMASFIPNLERSRIIARDGLQLRVEQQGRAWLGPFSLTFGSTREIELVPQQEIRARQLVGTARAMSSTMRLQADGGGTRLEYRAEVTPDGGFLTALLGPAAIRHELAEQFAAILWEIARRDGLAKGIAERRGAPPSDGGQRPPL